MRGAAGAAGGAGEEPGLHGWDPLLGPQGLSSGCESDLPVCLETPAASRAREGCLLVPQGGGSPEDSTFSGRARLPAGARSHSGGTGGQAVSPHSPQLSEACSLATGAPVRAWREPAASSL